MNYAELLAAIVTIVDKYSLAYLLAGFDASLINVLLINYIDAVRAANTYLTTVQMINQGLSAHLGTDLIIDMFITNESDRQQLFVYFTTWRNQLLLENTETNTV